MDFLEKICLPFFQNHLRKKLQNQKRQRKTHNLWTARRIAILFDAATEADQNEFLGIAKALEKEGKTVGLLGYFHKNKLETAPKFDFLTKKMTDWKGRAKEKNAPKIEKEPFDLLLVFNPNARWPLENIAISIVAATKIGNHTPYPNDFDLMLELPKNSGAKFFLDQLDIYLDKIVPANEHLFAKI